MPAAIPIAIGAAGGLGFLGARSQANAAKDAAQTQAESTDKALALQREMWAAQQQNQAPWVSAGQGAVSTLARLMGTPQPAMAMPSQGPQNAMGGQTNMLARIAGGPRTIGTRAAGAVLGQQGMVVLRAPDGSTQAVPEAQAEHYISRGAARVN